MGVPDLKDMRDRVLAKLYGNLHTADPLLSGFSSLLTRGRGRREFHGNIDGTRLAILTIAPPLADSARRRNPKQRTQMTF
jgi:hypothetical protein